MINLLKSEAMKLSRSRLMVLLVLVEIGLALSVTSTYIGSVGTHLEAAIAAPQSGYAAFMGRVDIPTLLLTGVLLCGLVVSADFDNRTIQVALGAGHSRAAVLISKFAALFVALFALQLAYWLTNGLMYTAHFGFGMPVSLGLLLHMLASFGCVVLTGVALSSVAVLLAFTTRKTAITVGLSAIILLIGGSMLITQSKYNPALERALAWTPIGVLNVMTDNGRSWASMGQAALVSAVSITAIGGLTWALFRKADLQ